MLSLPKGVRVFFALEPTDMRKQMDGLAIVTRERLDRDPRSGEMFVFRNRRGDMARVLFYDRQGYCLLSKRLDKGTFAKLGSDLEGVSMELSVVEFARFLTAKR